MNKRLIKNAVLNVGRGMMSALVAVIVPPVLIRHMDSATYAVWVLVLQVVGYMAFIDLGLQTAVGRYVAYAEQKQDARLRDSIFSTAFAGLSIAALLGFTIIIAISVCAGRIFPNIPLHLLPPMRQAMLIAGFSLAIGLPVSAWNGVFVGLQRYGIPSGTTAAGKLLTSLGLIFAALAGKSLVWMGTTVALVNFAIYVVQYGLLRRIVPDIHFQYRSISRESIKELAHYCATLTIWSASTFLISGMDLLLVGRFQFNAVTPYSAAAVLVSFFGGLQLSIFNVIMPHAAALHAAREATALGELLRKTTRLGFFILLLSGIPLIVCGRQIIHYWIGSQFVAQGSTILTILVLAQFFRLIMLPYSTILLGTGQQQKTIISPIMEGLANLIASIVLGLHFGAFGVAWGTLFGAIIGILFHFFYNLPRTQEYIALPRRQMLLTLVEPALRCILPFAFAAPLAWYYSQHAQYIWWVAMCVSLLAVLQSAIRNFWSRRQETSYSATHD